MASRLLHGLRRTATRATIALLAGGALVFGYGAAVIWYTTGTLATTLLWLLIAPLAILIGALASALVLVWDLAPAITVVRVVRYLAARAAELPRRMPRRLPRVGRASLRDAQPEALSSSERTALPAPIPETIIIDAPARRSLPRLPDAA